MLEIECDILQSSDIVFDGSCILGPPDGPSKECLKIGAHVARSGPICHLSGTCQLTSATWLDCRIVFLFYMSLIDLMECLLSQ